MPKPLPLPRSNDLQALHDQLVARYGNITIAAAIARVPSGTLYRWLRKGIPYGKTHIIDQLLKDTETLTNHY
jgi:hypothetical protein